MTTAGTLNLVLGADSTKLRQELGRVRQESQTTALAIANLFSGDTINAAGFRILRGTVVGVIHDIDEMNQGLSLSDSLTRNLAHSFNDLGDIALLQLGQIAKFLGDDLFKNPVLAGFQAEALDKAGLGQLEGSFQVLTAGINAAKLAQPALAGIQQGFSAIDDVLGLLQGKAAAVSEFFGGISRIAKLTGGILTNVAGIIDDSIEEVINTLARINPAFATAKNAAGALGIEFKVGRAFLGEYIDDLQRLEKVADGASRASGAVANGAETARKGVDEASDSVRRFQEKLERQRKAGELAKGAMEELADAASLFEAYNQVNETFERFFGNIEQSFNAAKELDNLTRRLQTTSNSSGGARQDLQFLNQLTADLGTNFNATAEGYAQFSAAAKQTNYTAEQTNQIFQDVAESAAVMRLSAADTEGVFLALRQSLSGGNVQLQELNQLAERIPGAFQAAEVALRQMGYATGSVRDVISTGTVDAEQFVSVFSAQLASTTQSGVVGASQSAEAAVNRFNNSLYKLQVAMGQTWLQVGTPALNTFSEALNFAAKNEELISTAIDALLVAATLRGLSAVVTFTKAVFTSGQVISLFGRQITLTAAQIGRYALQAGLAYAATILFYRNLERAQDSAQNTRTAIASLSKSIAELQDASGQGANSLTKIFPKDPPPLDYIDAAVVGLESMSKEGNLAEKAFAFLAKSGVAGVGIELNKLINFFKTGQYEFVSAGEKALNDQLAAIGDFAQKAQDILGSSLELRFETKAGQGPINELKQIDALLKGIEQRKLGVDPNDAKAIAQIKAEEEALLKRRAEAQKQVLATQSALNNALAQARTELQNLDPSKLGQQGYDQAKAEIQTQITLLEREKGKLDELAQTAVTTAKTITDSFKESTAKLDQSFADNQAAIAEALASGSIDEDAARKQNLAAERQYLEDKLKLNREKLQELKTELERDSKLRAVDPQAAGLLDEGQLQQYKEDVEKLELETAQTRLTLAQRVTQGKSDQLDQELEDLRQANDEAKAIVERSQNDRIAAIRQRQLSGAISAQDAETEIEAVRKAGISREIELENQRLAQIRELRQQGTLSAKDAAEQESEILGRLSDLNLQNIEAEVQAREKANQRMVDSYERAARRAEQAIAQSQNQRVAAIQQQQLNSVRAINPNLPEQEQARQREQIERDTQAQIQQIQQSSLDEQVAQVQSQLTEVAQLRQQGALEAEDAADREIELQGRLGELNLQRIQNQIQGEEQVRQAIEAQRQARIDAINESVEAERNAAEARQGFAQLQTDSISRQNELLQSQSGLLQAQSDLTQQRLQFALQDAEEKGRTSQAERLRLQILEQEAATQREQFQIQQQELELKKEQLKLDVRSKQIQADIAITEAEIALQTARINGVSQEQINSLERILQLRNAQRDAIEDQTDAQERSLALEQQTLDVKRKAANEDLARRRQLENQDPFSAAGSGSGGSSGGGSGGSGAASGGDGIGIGAMGSTQIGQLTQAREQVGAARSTQELLRLSSLNGGYVDQLLAAQGRGDVLKLSELSRSGGFEGKNQAAAIARAIDSGQLSSKEAVDRLDKLIAAVQQGLSRPNLTVNPQDAGLAGRIWADLGRSEARLSNL